MNVMIRTVARSAIPLAMAAAFVLLFQGHNSPGGGFIAAVLTVLAIALIHIAYDSTFIEEWLFPGGGATIAGRLRAGTLRSYRRVTLWGLAFAALLSGVGAMVFGRPFLTQTFRVVELPLLGPYEVTTSLVFDVGVYLVVLGSLLTILEVMSRA